MSAPPVRIVLVRPEHAGNVGAAARAMKNFGLDRLVLAGASLDDPARAVRRAHGAEDILEGADLHPTLADALAGCTRAWAFTRRRGKHRAGSIHPEAAARATRAAVEAGEEVAWVFGPESTGLSAEDLALCSDQVSIPTAPEQPSMNLAQAVAVACYVYAGSAREPAPPSPPRPAPIESRQAFYGHLERALLAIGFLHPHTAAARMEAIRRYLERSRPTEREVRFLRGIARQMEWVARRAGNGDPPPG